MSFRDWTRRLREVRGNQPNWPWLLGFALEDEFRRQCTVETGYSGEVFLDRDEQPYREGDTERRMVGNLYHVCLSENSGCLKTGDEDFWLLGYEWPNQGGDQEKGRRADLVGLTTDGGLVVFECKRHDNDDPPFTALVEGLDYLASLLRGPNFSRIIEGTKQWRNSSEKTIPDSHRKVEPRLEAKAAIIVLAPKEYFAGRYTRSRRGQGWADLAAVSNQVCDSFRIGFAISDFKTPTAQWVDPGSFS